MERSSAADMTLYNFNNQKCSPCSSVEFQKGPPYSSTSAIQKGTSVRSEVKCVSLSCSISTEEYPNLTFMGIIMEGEGPAVCGNWASVMPGVKCNSFVFTERDSNQTRSKRWCLFRFSFRILVRAVRWPVLDLIAYIQQVLQTSIFRDSFRGSR